MTRPLSSLGLALIAACSFDPHGLDPGGDAARDDAATDGVDPIDGGGGIDGRTADAAIDAPMIDAPPLECPSGYTVLGTGTYRHATVPATWEDARGDCEDDDDTGTSGRTHLVVLSGEVERIGVRSIFTGPTLWIGLSDRVTTATWRWVTLEPTGTYPPASGNPPWKGGQPNDGTGGTEDCVEMQANGLWDDRPCDADLNEYICECDAFAEVESQSEP